MPAGSESHLLRSAQNETAASAVAGAWAIVIRFYSALHLLQAYFIVKGIDVVPENHGQRSRAIRDNPELSVGRGQAFRRVYDRLRNMSEQVRYDPAFQATTADIEQSRADLDAVISFLKPKLSESPRS